jgi:hypothetical protein
MGRSAGHGGAGPGAATREGPGRGPSHRRGRSGDDLWVVLRPGLGVCRHPGHRLHGPRAQRPRRAPGLLLALLWWTWSADAWLGNQARADEGVLRVGWPWPWRPSLSSTGPFPRPGRTRRAAWTGRWCWWAPTCWSAVSTAPCPWWPRPTTTSCAISSPSPGDPCWGARPCWWRGRWWGGPRRCCSPGPCWWTGSASGSPPARAAGGCQRRALDRTTRELHHLGHR